MADSEGDKLDRISYKADDTFDGNRGADIYPMGGTKIEKGKKVFIEPSWICIFSKGPRSGLIN